MVGKMEDEQSEKEKVETWRKDLLLTFVNQHRGVNKKQKYIFHPLNSG